MFLRIISALACCAALAAPCSADQTEIENYPHARERIFYRLYVGVRQYESTDIYCGLRFRVAAAVAKLPEGAETGRPATWITLEHAYAADWMADALACGDRDTCAVASDETIRKRFNNAEADMHNLWPALGNLNSSRGKRPFGEVGDPKRTEQRAVKVGEKTFQCDFENVGGIVEPRRIVRGNLARSIFYMCQEYGFPVDPKMLIVLKRWNAADPPTQGERRRNDRIEAWQRTRNVFIDDPSLADNLTCNGP